MKSKEKPAQTRESIEQVVQKTVDVIESFFRKYGKVELWGRLSAESLIADMRKKFIEALRDPESGTIQWTPSAPGFKRITWAKRWEAKINGGYRAIVVDLDDHVSIKKTKELNRLIRKASGSFWF